MCTVKDPESVGKEFFLHTLKLLSESQTPSSTSPPSTPAPIDDHQSRAILEQLKQMNDALQAIQRTMEENSTERIVETLLARLAIPNSCDRSAEVEKWIVHSATTDDSASCTTVDFSIEEEFERLNFDEPSSEPAALGSALFSHWQDRFNSTPTEASKFLFGSLQSSPTKSVLPYNSTIDLNVWLK